MVRICYESRTFRPAALQVIEQANVIIAAYQRQGFTLTVRQLYYQFVSRGYIPNNQREYTKLCSTVNDARLAGKIDWHAIVDLTRTPSLVHGFESPEQIIESAAHGYFIDKWQDQPIVPEVWVEKDALSSIVRSACEVVQVGSFSCRGYASQTAVWEAAQRMIRRYKGGQETVIVHLGDHDPSGIDMTRDITDRLALFCRHHGCPAPVVRRIALTMDQVGEYNPPPNPAKLSDSRSDAYIALYGDESWELDALEPSILRDLITSTVVEYRDDTRWQAMEEREQSEQQALALLSGRWDDIREYLMQLAED